MTHDRSGLRALGDALSARAADVVAQQVVLIGAAHAMDGAKPLATVRSFAEWLATGEVPKSGAIETIISSGGEQLASEIISVGSATRSCLAWRDAVIVVLREEAGRLGVPADALAHAVSAARASCDAFTVRLGQRFDSERVKLREALDLKNAQLERQARRDHLTGVANRACFFEELTEAFGTSPRDRSRVAVLFVDLDGFKAVNDQLGHFAGDRVLRVAAERLERAIRPGDLLSRFGGDEFVILCRDIGVEGPEAVATSIADRIRAAFAEPFSVDDRTTIAVSASVGVAIGDHIVDSAEALVTAADAAMYVAKNRACERTAPAFGL